MENSERLLENSLLVIWNDRDAESRLKVMKEVYTEDINSTNQMKALRYKVMKLSTI